jgi:hypothetical protein
MAKGLDIGTMYVVSSQNTDQGTVFRKQRNAFYTMSREDFEDGFSCNSPMVIRKGSDVHIVGDDSVRYANLSGKSKKFKRPMAKGVLNPLESDAIGVLQIVIQNVLGEPAFPGETVAVTSPADPLDGTFDTTFHKTVLSRHLKNLGYKPMVLNEAHALVYSENPICQSEGEDIPFSGIGISFGAGMVNMVATWRAQKLLEFSVSRGGDWIDTRVHEATQIPVSRVLKFKEGKFQHSAEYARDVEVKMASALEIYTEDLIRYVLEAFAEKFDSCDASIDDPIEIIVGGGTSMVPGFIDLFAEIAGETDLPFDVLSVRHAVSPLCAVSNGALIAASSREKKERQNATPTSVNEVTSAPVSAPAAAAPVNQATLAPAQPTVIGQTGPQLAEPVNPQIRRIAVASTRKRGADV